MPGPIASFYTPLFHKECFAVIAKLVWLKLMSIRVFVIECLVVLVVDLVVLYCWPSFEIENSNTMFILDETSYFRSGFHVCFSSVPETQWNTCNKRFKALALREISVIPKCHMYLHHHGNDKSCTIWKLHGHTWQCSHRCWFSSLDFG